MRPKPVAEEVGFIFTGCRYVTPRLPPKSYNILKYKASIHLLVNLGTRKDDICIQ